MKITVITVGKTTSAYRDLLDDYIKRTNRYVPFAWVDLPDVKNRGKLPVARLKNEEGRAIMDKLSTGDEVYLFDEKGTTYTSTGFSAFLQKRMNAGTRNLVFVIGGAYGFSEELYRKASGKISLSDMTLPHQLVRLVAAEQIYRAFSIMNNEPYHHS